MTTIITSQDLSGAKLVNFRSPIPDATVCAFVGDRDIPLKNSGTAGDLTLVGTAPSQDDLFRRLSDGSYIRTGVSRTPETTIIAVYRGVASGGYNIIASSERDASDGGRRGITLARGIDGVSCMLSMWGTNPATEASSSVARTVSVSETEAAFVVGQYRDQLPSSAGVRVERKTSPAATTTFATNTNSSFGVTADEESYEIRLGATYRATPSEVDLGFIMIVPRILTAAEIETVYSKVKRRFEALGQPI